LLHRQANRLNISRAERRADDADGKVGGQDRRRVLCFWGVFHLVAANAVYALAEQSTGMVRARLLQDAVYLLFFRLPAS